MGIAGKASSRPGALLQKHGNAASGGMNPKRFMPGNSALAKRATVSDIAAGCSVSRATASLAHVDTRARVQAEIVRQGHVYRRGAASLRRRSSHAVALVPNNLSNPFFAEFAGGVDAALAEADDVMLLGSAGESPGRPVLARLRGEARGDGTATIAPARLVVRASSLATPSDRIHA
jgi:hypothetical protein